MNLFAVARARYFHALLLFYSLVSRKRIMSWRISFQVADFRFIFACVEVVFLLPSLAFLFLYPAVVFILTMRFAGADGACALSQ